MGREAWPLTSMDQKRPQLSLDELYLLKWLLGGILVLLSVWTVFYLEFEAWTLMGLTTVGVIAALIRPGLPARMPTWAHRLVFPAVLIFFVGDLWLTGQVLPAIVRLDILLLLYRGTSYRQKRDDLQVIVLGLFLIVVAGVLTVSLVFAVQILVFTACALGFLLVITLVDSAETGSAKTLSVGRPGWTHLGWRRLLARVSEVSDWRVITLGTALFIGVVVVSGLLFLAIPRFQLENSLFLERFVSKKARTGFNESITFGDVTAIQQDTSIALSVDVTDRSQIPASPYWRMLVLDDYRNGAFRLSPRLRQTAFTQEFTGSAARGTSRAHLGEPVYWTFYFEAGVSRYLPLLGTFEALRFRETQNYRLAAKLGLLALRDEPATMTAYRVEGMNTSDTLADASFALRLKDRKAPDRTSDLTRMLRLGVNEPDQQALARVVREITGDREVNATELAGKVSEWLDQRHAYSLNPTVPEGAGDPLVRWMVSREGGHCELFAGSFVLLVRAAGVPARIVTGFRGGTWNGYSNNFTIRNSDAHAWCEVFDATAGAWRRFDPTPGSSSGAAEQAKGEATLARRLDRSWAARWESLRVFWYRRIVNFDQRTQMETLQAVKAATQNSGKQLRVTLSDAIERLKAWLAAPWNAQRVAAAAVIENFHLETARPGMRNAWQSCWRRWRCLRARLGPGGSLGGVGGGESGATQRGAAVTPSVSKPGNGCASCRRDGLHPWSTDRSSLTCSACASARGRVGPSPCPGHCPK